MANWRNRLIFQFAVSTTHSINLINHPSLLLKNVKMKLFSLFSVIKYCYMRLMGV